MEELPKFHGEDHPREHIEKNPADSETESPLDTGRLKGKLLEQVKAKELQDSKEISRLRGSLLEVKTNLPEPYSKEWLQQQVYIQRDSGERFILQDILNGRYSEVVQLKSPGTKQTVTLELSVFVERLKTPGSAWSTE